MFYTTRRGVRSQMSSDAAQAFIKKYGDKEDTAHPEIPAVGNYITLTGKADRIDPVFRTLQVGDTVVPFGDLVKISGEGIMEIDQYLGISED